MAGAQPHRSPIKVPRPATILAVDCDGNLRRLLESVNQEFQPSFVVRESSARNLDLALLTPSPEVVLANLSVSRVCLELLPTMQQLWPDAKVIFVSDWEDVHLYAEAIQLGAYDFLPMPIQIDELGSILQRAVQPACSKPELRQGRA